MKITKSQLKKIIQEELEKVNEGDYDEDNPTAAEMMADAMQDGLKKLMPKYDLDKDMERRVHYAVMKFASELHELMNFPAIKVDPDRYFGHED